MNQTAAILIDAYRELNARKLFWITLLLSGLVVAVFAFIGINENGVRIIAWDVEVFGINSEIMPPEMFYKVTFLGLGINMWLTWAAAILALISTASIFPDFVSGGSIDLVLSKPIGRWRLFLMKYATGLLFVTLQVTVFSVASFLVIGFRGGVWEPAILLAIPIVVVFFSYLFSVCVLVGLLTRSTIAALLLTILFWFLIFGVHGAESILLQQKLVNEHRVSRLEQTVEFQRQALETIRQNGGADDAAGRVEDILRDRQQELEQSRTTLDRLGIAHRITYGVKTVLPKTSETIGLLQRYLIDVSEVTGFDEPAGERPETWQDYAAAEQSMAEEVYERSIAWIVGTSLIFEAFVLLLAGWIFVRRDF